MKPQDILFFLVFIALLYKRNPYYSVWVGILSLLISIPLFAMYIFFTAEHLVYYSAAFFLLAILLFLFQNKKYL